MIHSFEYCLSRGKGWGQVSSLSDLIVTAISLEGVAVGDGVIFEQGEIGRVIEVAKDSVSILRLTGKDVSCKERVAATGSPLLVSCGTGMLGKVVSPLGYVISGGKDKSSDTDTRPIDLDPVGIESRSRISRYAETGISVIDTALPLGIGQRELLLGDRKSGKTELALNMLVSQVKSGSIGIYVAIGKKTNEVVGRVEWLKRQGALDKCIIVASTASSSTGENFIAPFTGMTIAEWWRDQGYDVTIILDDLSTHAKYYREIGLAAGKFPGRDSYPGDVFYTHAKLLERAGNFRLSSGRERAITAIPIAEAVGSELTGYITTNLMSITDGHWYLDSELFLSGARPAVNIFLSVTRVGRQTQPKALRVIGEAVVKALKEEAEVARFVRFGAELSQNAQLVASRGRRLRQIMNQETGHARPWQISAYLVLSAWEKEIDTEYVDQVVKAYKENKTWRKTLEDYLDQQSSSPKFWQNYPPLHN